MKKFRKYLFAMMLSLLIIPFVSVKAETLNVKTIHASITTDQISVDGTVDDGVLAVAILVYEEDGTTLVTMETTSVDSSNQYADTISVASGKKYIVKAANYDGGTYATTEVDGSINNSGTNSNHNEKNPQTYDNLMTWIILLVVSISGIVGTSIYFKKKM